jgi:hypothetical protein
MATSSSNQRLEEAARQALNRLSISASGGRR